MKKIEIVVKDDVSEQDIMDVFVKSKFKVESIEIFQEVKEYKLTHKYSFEDKLESGCDMIDKLIKKVNDSNFNLNGE